MGRGAVQNMVSIWKSRGMSLGLKVRFLRATAFPIAIYGCESWAMTSGDKKRVDAFEMWCYRRLLTDGKENKQMGVGEDWVYFDVEKGYVGEEDEVLWPHRPEGRHGEKTDARKMEGKRRRGRPATTWFQDLKEWTKLDIAGASQLATDRERWRKIIKVTAAQIAPPD